MSRFLTITASPAFRDMSGRFARATEQLKTDKRDMMSAIGQRWVEVARDEAPHKTGKFAKGIFARTYESGNDIKLIGYAPDPLATFIQEGTRPHPIPPSSANALYFFWPKVGMYTVVPKGGGFRTHVQSGKLWVGKGYVNHPGTKPNPFLTRTWERTHPEIDTAVRRIAARYAMVIVGGNA